MLSTLLTAAAIVLVIVVGLAGLVWWKQEGIVYQPPRPPYPDAPRWATRVTYGASDGQPLLGYLVTRDDLAAPRHEPGPLLLAFHGNADLAVWQIPWAREVARRTGARVLLAEYRGYAGLGGTPDYEGSRRDARAAYEFARDSLGASAADVALFGHSLGSGVAAELADWLAGRGEPPRALILQSPFTSARAMTRLLVARPVAWAWSAISRVHYDSERVVGGLATPVWIAHGERDGLVPARMGRELFAAARVKGELLLVPGAGHNDVAEVGGKEYWRWIGRAVTESVSAGR